MPNEKRPSERAHQGVELADEAAHAGQTDRREHEGAEEGRVERHRARQAPEELDLAGVGALVDDADEEEEGGGVQPVREHHHHRALQRLLIEGEDAERHEAHVADRRIGDQPLQVGLRPGDQRAVDDRDDREDHDRRGEHSAPPPGKSGRQKRNMP